MEFCQKNCCIGLHWIQDATYHCAVNTIHWQTKALKQMRKLPAEAGRAIRVAVIEDLAQLANARNLKQRANHTYVYRLRVGNYRVSFEFDGAIRIATIDAVRPRNEQTD